MVIPTQKANPMFAEGNDFQAEMIRYIRMHFAGVLGGDVRLLDLPNGIEILARKYGPAPKVAAA